MDSSDTKDLRFPENFLFGVATASYQIEGGWDADGKGENIWDRCTHEHPEFIADRSNGDIACDSYNQYKEDVRLAKDLGSHFYRFSISWARVLPYGTIDKINEAGIQYYSNLINELLANNIEPVVTIFHWDLPQKLQELGGWTNPNLAYFFQDYAELLFEKFGDRVKWWITLNEPGHIARSYTTKDLLLAPCLDLRHLGADYMAVQTLLKAHAMAYHVYRKQFWKLQRGKIGITLHTFWYEPLTNSKEDAESAESAIQYDLGIFSHPIFSEQGDFPPIVLKIMEDHRKSSKLSLPFLPSLGEEWIQKIKGTADFLGLNHYTTRWAQPGNPDWWLPDLNVTLSIDEKIPGAKSVWLKTVPWGLRKLLNWIKNSYKNPPVFISENGFSDSGELHDVGRIDYMKKYMREVLKATVLDDCQVLAYAVWSLIDNFEWLQGYTEKFGLYHVDFNDPKRTRRAKTSVNVIKQIITSRQIPQDKDLIEN
ncbi:hypothetical protein R5R35_003959 [Gryllus longicercus]|uniref:beta-glucosidase n=1 Tax=Gryllus longicercus TaxID=2509291 RepID=A0AAN9VDH9_9ORTH